MKLLHLFWRATIPVLIGCLLLHINIAAQDEMEPIFEAVGVIVNLMWLEDENQLAFREDLVEEINAPHFSHLIQWEPEQPASEGVVSLAEVGEVQALIAGDLFAGGLPDDLPVAQVDGAAPFIFVSPNDRYALYPAERPEGWTYIGWPLGLTDLHDGRTVVIQDDMITNDDPQFYWVRWSADGTAFTIEIIRSPMEPKYYISGYAEEIENPEVMSFYQSVTIGDDVLDYPRSFALTADGDQVLVEGGIFGVDNRLAVWVPGEPEAGETIAIAPVGSRFLGGTFIDEDSAILYVGPDGLAHYDRDSGETTILDASINSEVVGRAEFSPDGTRLAFTNPRYPGVSGRYLYVVDVPLPDASE
jgi:hypothetical protein